MSGSRRSPVWISHASRIQTAGSRWSETRTSQSGSRNRRRTIAEPIVPAPPVTSTRLACQTGQTFPADPLAQRSRIRERLGRLGRD